MCSVDFLLLTATSHSLPPVWASCWSSLRFNTNIRVKVCQSGLAEARVCMKGEHDSPWLRSITRFTTKQNKINSRNNRTLSLNWPALPYLAVSSEEAASEETILPLQGIKASADANTNIPLFLSRMQLSAALADTIYSLQGRTTSEGGAKKVHRKWKTI